MNQQDPDSRNEQEQELAYSRKELVYMTKIYTKAHRYEEAVIFSLQFIEMNPNLTVDERSLFVTAFKYPITKKRAAWRKIHNLEKQEIKECLEKEVKNQKNNYLKEVRHKIESELRELISQMITTLSNLLLPSSEDNIDNAVYYFKLKGDYLRYLAEITGGKDRELALTEADESYSYGYQIAEEGLSITSVTRLGLCLNYSVFLWEMRELQQEAAILAQNVFNQAVDKIDQMDKEKSKEIILIVQLLRENLLMWSKQVAIDNDEEGENPDNQDEDPQHINNDDDIMGLEAEY
jgi:hypothetical protein